MIKIQFCKTKNPIIDPITKSKMGVEDTFEQEKTNPDGFGLIPKSQPIKNIQCKVKACSVQYIL